MSASQSNVSRQIQASLSVVQTLSCQIWNSPQAMAERLASIREEALARLTQIIAAESEHLSNSVCWRDVFCHECDGIECVQGTARDLAIKIHDLGWVALSHRRPNITCPACQEV